MSQQAIQTTQPQSTAATIRSWMANPEMSRPIETALAGYVDPKQFAAAAFIAAQDEKLAQCDPRSLFRALLSVALMGLLPGKHYGHVALIPRQGQIDVMPMWAGYLALLRRQPGIVDVKVTLVHALDEFLADENGEVIHRFNPLDERRIFEHPEVAAANKRTCDLVGGYATIERAEGVVTRHFMLGSKILRNMSVAQTKNVWTKFFEEMARKSIVRDLWARRIIPIEAQLQERLGAADEADNAALGNDPDRSVAPAPDVPKLSRTVALTARVTRQPEPISASYDDGAVPPDQEPPEEQAPPAAKASRRAAREPGEDG